MPEKHSKVIIIGRDKICAFYDIGKDTFYDLIQMGAPVTKINNRHAIHRDTFEEFVKKLTLKK